ncbi:MAG: MlaD family protein [Candidatus Omnitrophota bacterium]
MQCKDQAKKIFAGIFLFVCVALIAGVVFTIGLEKGFIEPRFTMTALFHKVGGLNPGAPVRLSGVTVGTVENIDFLDESYMGRGVKVELSLYAKYKDQLRKSRRVAIVTEGVLGEKMVDISADPDLYRDDLSRAIVGEDPLEVRDLAETFDASAAALLGVSEEFGTLAGEVEDVTRSTRRLLNRIEQRIIDGNLFKVF